MEPGYVADIPGYLSDIQEYVLEGTGSIADIQESTLEVTVYVLEAPGYISDVINFNAEVHGLRRKVPQFKYLGLRCRLEVLVWAGDGIRRQSSRSGSGKARGGWSVGESRLR